MDKMFFSSCAVLFLCVSACNNPEIRREKANRELPSPPIARQSGNGGGLHPQYDLGVSDNTHAAPDEPQPIADPSEIVVAFHINPSKAKLEIDGTGIPVRGIQPRTKLLTRGPHNVRVELENYPTVIETIVVDPKQNQFTYDLDKYYVAVRIKSEVQLTLIVDERKYIGAGPHKLLPGNKQLAFEPAIKCFTLDPSTQRNVNWPPGSTQTIEVKWIPAQDDTLLIQPQVREGRELFAAFEPTIKVNGRTLSSSDGGTAYKIPCGAQRIEVSKRGYSSSSIEVDSAEYRNTKGRWTPILEEDQMSGRHVDCHEVTVRDYDDYLRFNTPRSMPGMEPINSHNFSPHNRKSRQDHPVNVVTYEAAREFCEWRAREKGKTTDGRVATVVDLRAVAGFTTGKYEYPWGNDHAPNCERVVMRQFPNRDGCIDPPQRLGTTSPVCSKPKGKTRFGHCDILGNVAEWVAPDKIFGGGFRDGLESHKFSLATDPTSPPRSSSDNIGFRCAWNLPAHEKCSCNKDIDHATH